MKNILIIFSIFIFSSTVEAQSLTHGHKTSMDKKRLAQSAKTLSDKEKIAFATNNNNGRSNKDNCCGSVTASNNNQLVILDIQSKWYLVDAASNQQNLVDNPISMFAQTKTEWEVELRTGEGVYVSQKLIGIQSNKVILSTTGLANGQYYIELLFNGAIYRTAFSKGKNRPNVPRSTNSKLKKGRGN